jgi:hypothetical protein
MRVVDNDTQDLPASSPQEIVILVGDCITRVRRGALDPRVANAVGYLATVTLRALEVGQLEDRLKQLESAFSRCSRIEDGSAFERRIDPQTPSNRSQP